MDFGLLLNRSVTTNIQLLFKIDFKYGEKLIDEHNTDIPLIVSPDENISIDEMINISHKKPLTVEGP